MAGIVQTIRCTRGGRERWTRQVWVPVDDITEFYARWHVCLDAVRYDVLPGGVFKLRKPRGIAHWRD